MYKIIGGDGREYGPVSLEQLRDWIAQGRATAQTQIQVEGSPDWKPLRAYPELAGLVTIQPAQSAMPVVAPRVKTNGFAITGMILGIWSVSLGWLCCYTSLLTAPLGIVFSAVALNQIKMDEFQSGRGMAIAGLITSVLGILLLVLLLVFFGVAGWMDSQGMLE